MDAVGADADLRENLAALREDALTLAILFAAVLGYAWFLWVGLTKPQGLGLLSSWAGVALLTLSAVASHALRARSLHTAAQMLVWSTLGAVACAMLAFPAAETAYLTILPIIFASVLLSQSAHLLVAAAAGLLIISIGFVRIGAALPSPGATLPILLRVSLARLFSRDLAVPVAIIALVAAASWISSHNLYTALTWVLHGYERVRRNEEELREHQGDLRRALKALDEATYRLERANYMLALARDQADEARRLKQQFAQTISHELRTPLNLIVGFTELMTESPEYYGEALPPAYWRDLNIVHRNACHLQDMINDVLDLARIEAAQMNLVLMETDPTELVEEAVTTARSLIEARGLTLRTRVEPGLPRLSVDPVRIRQVLFNLLNNAARFTHEGGVTIEVCRQGEEVIFAVADTGVGIAPGDLQAIFDEFRQADGGTRRTHEGAGLGLAISRRFVELHGGRIWVESEVGKGSTFRFSLPVGQPDPIAHGRSPQEAASPPSGEEPILLAITRSPSAAALLRRYVRGFRTVVVSDLEQGKNAARQLMPQVTVIDETCENLDAERLGELARAWELPRVPFVACPLPGEGSQQRLAVDSYLIKPVSRRSVWDVLRQFGEKVDRLLIIDDDQDFVLLMGRMLEDNPVRRYQVISAYNGQEGLTLARRHQPDLIFLDLGLPDVAGYQVIGKLRSDPQLQQTPIVIVSGQDEISNQQAMRGAITIARADGIMPSEVVRWIQQVADAALSSQTVLPASTAAPAR